MSECFLMGTIRRTSRESKKRAASRGSSALNFSILWMFDTIVRGFWAIDRGKHEVQLKCY